MHRTAFAGLTALDPNDQITVDGSSFLYGNTPIIDRLLRVGCVTHRHDAHLGIGNPVGTLSASVTQTGGQIPAGTTIYMGYTLVDSQGGETMLSPVVTVNTQGPIIPDVEPPTASAQYTGGQLPVGGYSYAINYRDAAGGRTELQPAVFVEREPGHASGQVLLGELDAGLGGGLVSWELWRAGEGGNYDLLASGATNTFLDTGYTCTDCTAEPPTVNTTNETSHLEVRLPTVGSDPYVASASTIDVYFTTDGSFSTPALQGVYPVASAGDTFNVTALELDLGSPPNANRSLAGAHKIDFDSETTGPWRDAVAASGVLPSVGNQDGDVREVLSDHSVYIWNATAKAWERPNTHMCETQTWSIAGAVSGGQIPGPFVKVLPNEVQKLLGIECRLGSGTATLTLKHNGVAIGELTAIKAEGGVVAITLAEPLALASKDTLTLEVTATAGGEGMAFSAFVEHTGLVV
jgi:hypothetical protein